VALALSEIRHLGVASTLVTVLVGGGAPAGLYLAWAAYRDASAASAGHGTSELEATADQLALAIRTEWETEAGRRRLNDPYPLPVGWIAADSSLVDPWPEILRLAATGAGWRPSTAANNTAFPQLAGAGAQLVDVLAGIPTRRLVVLGEPGAGKSMLMVRLLLDLLARRRPGTQVPVLVPLASWNPAHQDLIVWLESTLGIGLPSLTDRMTEHGKTTRFRALLSEGLILPILDGLDEIPEPNRGRAIAAVNDAMLPGQPLVLTCRTSDYRDAVQPAGRPAITLRGAAAVELRPLHSTDVEHYLCQDAGAVGQARWAPVLRELGNATPLARVLSSPLMASMARDIYNPRPGDPIPAQPDPAELCGLADESAITERLLDAFVPAAYQKRIESTTGGVSWSTSQAERWLAFLAAHLERTVRSTDLAWWQLINGARGAITWLLGLSVWIAACLYAGASAITYSNYADVNLARFKYAVPFVISLLFGGVILCAAPAAVAAFLLRRERLPARGGSVRGNQDSSLDTPVSEYVNEVTDRLAVYRPCPIFAFHYQHCGQQR